MLGQISALTKKDGERRAAIGEALEAKRELEEGLRKKEGIIEAWKDNKAEQTVRHYGLAERKQVDSGRIFGRCRDTRWG